MTEQDGGSNMSAEDDAPPPPPSFSACPLLLRLHQILASYSINLIEPADFDKSQQLISELVDFLNSISDSLLKEPETQTESIHLENNAFQILTEIHRYLDSSSLAQEFIDALSFELPKAVAKFACASKRCLDMAESIIHSLIDKCNPRDMLSILCEALGSSSQMCKVATYSSPILSGLPKVIVSIQRRQFEQAKAALPVILTVLKAVTLELDDEDTDSHDLFHRAICVANSIKTVCIKLEGNDNEKLHALFGLYLLQIMALISMGMRQRVSDSLPLVLQVSHFLEFCGLSYSGLIDGSDVNRLINLALGDDADDFLTCFSHIQHGASLAVIWGYKSSDIAMATKEDIAAVKKELQDNQIKRWQAVGMLKHIFSCANLPWDLKQHGIDFLLGILDGNTSQVSPDENLDYSEHMPSLYATLQAIQVVMMNASDATLRKRAFAALKKVLADFPTSLRFDILMALIKNSDSSSMIAVLLDCVKEEMRIEITKRTSVTNGALEAADANFQGTSFWTASVLELVELVLRPPKGGPPALPEYSDAVLSALNLYRFILITEYTGKTNDTGVLSKDKLQTAHIKWLLPLRTLVTGIVAENHKDYDEMACDVMCALNPVELVLYRCIELVEENLLFP